MSIKEISRRLLDWEEQFQLSERVGGVPSSSLYDPLYKLVQDCSKELEGHQALKDDKRQRLERIYFDCLQRLYQAPINLLEPCLQRSIYNPSYQIEAAYRLGVHYLKRAKNEQGGERSRKIARSYLKEALLEQTQANNGEKATLMLFSSQHDVLSTGTSRVSVLCALADAILMSTEARHRSASEPASSSSVFAACESREELSEKELTTVLQHLKEAANDTENTDVTAYLKENLIPRLLGVLEAQKSVTASMWLDMAELYGSLLEHSPDDASSLLGMKKCLPKAAALVVGVAASVPSCMQAKLHERLAYGFDRANDQPRALYHQRHALGHQIHALRCARGCASYACSVGRDVLRGALPGQAGNSGQDSASQVGSGIVGMLCITQACSLVTEAKTQLQKYVNAFGDALKESDNPEDQSVLEEANAMLSANHGTEGSKPGPSHPASPPPQSPHQALAQGAEHT